MKTLGSGQYQPTVYAYFPKTARGHGAMSRHERMEVPQYDKNGQLTGYATRPGKRLNELCNAVSCTLRNGKGERHHNQEQNRKDWEESVGLSRGTSRRSHPSNADPKGRLKS
jgi:hypothetical protein